MSNQILPTFFLSPDISEDKQIGSKLNKNFQDIVNSLLPAGCINLYGGATAPTGWLLCDGSAVSRTTYADLFASISTSFGTGDGSTTFNLPDCRGRVAIGTGTGSGLTARSLAATVGTETHTLTTAQIPA